MMKKIINTLLLVSGLALAISPIAQADTLENDNTETSGQYINSSAITAKVKSALLAKKNIDSNEISVQSETTTKGRTIVILTGTQKTQKLVDLAGLTVKQVKGVSKVVNKLTVAE